MKADWMGAEPIRGRPLGSRYLLVEKRGHGATGTVWRAIDRTTRMEVAAKVLRAEYANDLAIRARFVAEWTILSELEHDNIVKVRDLVTESGELAIVMDYVRSDLRRHLEERGTLPPAEAAAITIAVLRALAHAHGHRRQHGDVKPQNVLLQDGKVLLSDFGVARLLEESATQVSSQLGTTEYMAPEIFTVQQVSAATDVYAAGIQFYELLAGRTPFAGGGSQAVIGRHVGKLPPPLPGLPERLVSVLARMLAKEPSRRPPADVAARALEELLPGLDGVPRLAVQPRPELWEGTPEVGATDPWITAQEAADDSGGTRVHGEPRGDMPPQVVSDGALPPLSPADESAASGDTFVVQPPIPPGPPRAPVPTVQPVRRGSRRRRVALVVGTLAVVAAIAGLFAASSSGSGRDAGDTGQDASPAKADQEDDPLETGLSISRTAVYDPVSRQLRTTITWKAGRAPLTGPFYERVPDPDCQVAWTADSPPAVRDRTDGISAPCGFKIDVRTLDPGDRASATYEVDLDPAGKEPSVAAKDFLDQEAAETTAALDGLAQSADYPVQRLTGVIVDVPAIVFSQQRLRVRLLPLWAGVPQPDSRNVLFDSTATGPASLMLQKVAGGLPGVRLSARRCGDAIGVDDDLYLYTSRQATDCLVSARVGDLPEATSAPFDIGYSSGQP